MSDVPITHNTIVLEWDEKGNVSYFRSFDFPTEEVAMRAAIASIGKDKRPFWIGQASGLLHSSKFKTDEDE